MKARPIHARERAHKQWGTPAHQETAGARATSKRMQACAEKAEGVGASATADAEH